MRRIPGEEIVDFLSFSHPPNHVPAGFKNFRERDWKRALQWLDDSGLAFYFRRRLKDSGCANTIPTWVMSHLEQRFGANRQRVDEMEQWFELLNRKFNEAGVRFVVVKGLSIVPQFCSDAYLRHQSDFDYLVDEQSLPIAQRIVLETGYNWKPSSSNQDIVFIRGSGDPSRGPEQYMAETPHAVELHLDFWDSQQFNLPEMPRLFDVDRAITHRLKGVAFPVLRDEDAFLLQVLHAFQHIFTYWIRMSSLFEIGYFLNQRASDTSLWNLVEQRVGDNLVLREFVVVITELVANLFSAPVPPLVRVWAREIRPATRVWIENYARHCAFCVVYSHEFCLLPKSKLVLFLYRQYEDACVQRHLVRNRLVRFTRLSRIAASIKGEPSLVLRAGWWKRQLFVGRSVFHVLAGLRYVFEIPRWWWLNQKVVQSTTRPF